MSNVFKRIVLTYNYVYTNAKVSGFMKSVRIPCFSTIHADLRSAYTTLSDTAIVTVYIKYNFNTIAVTFNIVGCFDHVGMLNLIILHLVT
jgi:hypothetical protein